MKTLLHIQHIYKIFTLLQITWWIAALLQTCLLFVFYFPVFLWCSGIISCSVIFWSANEGILITEQYSRTQNCEHISHNLPAVVFCLFVFCIFLSLLLFPGDLQKCGKINGIWHHWWLTKGRHLFNNLLKVNKACVTEINPGLIIATVSLPFTSHRVCQGEIFGSMHWIKVLKKCTFSH